jgi:hypothetical protein
MGTGRYALKLSAVLIGTYLLAAHATQWGSLIKSAGSAGTSAVKTFQGR